MIRYCECGCGQEVKNRFTKGHFFRWNNKINNPMKNPEILKKVSEIHKRHKVSPETKKKLSILFSGENNPNYGNKYSEEIRKKISIAAKKRRLSEATKKLFSEQRRGKKNSFFGKKHTEESRKKMSKKRMTMYKKEKNPRWLGGISFLPYSAEFNKELKNKIRERDNQTCQNPHCNKKIKSGHVHHIDYNKKNCKEFNLITLCPSCHAKTSVHREYWMEFYQTIISSKEKYADTLSISIKNNK